MAIFDIENPMEAAKSAQSAGNGGSREVLESAYHAKFIEMAPEKSQKGEEKWVIKWDLIGAEEPEAKKQSVGAKRTQHFVVGHSKPEVAQSYQKDFLHILALLGVDVNALEDDGDLFMAGKKLAKATPVVCFYLKPQENNPKYLNWYPKGLMSDDLKTCTNLEGTKLPEWGKAEGNDKQPEVTAPAADDLDDL